MITDVTLARLGISMTYTCSFKLPQGQQGVTRPNVTVHVTRGYVGPDPMQMTHTEFTNLIVEPSGQNVPCMMVAPAFGQANATLDPDELYPITNKRYDRIMRNHL